MRKAASLAELAGKGCDRCRHLSLIPGIGYACCKTEGFLPIATCCRCVLPAAKLTVDCRDIEDLLAATADICSGCVQTAFAVHEESPRTHLADTVTGMLQEPAGAAGC